jgi:hypothetical protein
MSGPRKAEGHTFEVGGVTVTLARRTNRHALLTERVLLAIEDPQDDGSARAYKRLFARMVVQTVDTGGDLPITLPAPTASTEDLKAAYEAFLDADGYIGDRFYAELNIVNAPLGPRAFLPVEQLGDDEKKGSPKPGARGGRSDAPSSSG